MEIQMKKIISTPANVYPSPHKLPAHDRPNLFGVD